jgi:hypothetical protein
MELQSLRLLVTDAHLEALASRHAPKDAPIEDLKFAFTDEGVRVTGRYPTLMMRLSFETIWVLAVSGSGRVQARLTTLRVAGLPAGKFKGLLLNMARDVLADKPGVTLTDDAIEFDAEAAALSEGLPLKLNLRAIRCELGRLVVEAGV